MNTTPTRKPATKSADGILLDLHRQRQDLTARLDSIRLALDSTPEAVRTAELQGQFVAYTVAVQQLTFIIEDATY